MYTITFYSFKAAGRTLAVVNVAAELATRGRKILLVDFDLEAPALDTAANLRPKKFLPGMVEYVTHYMTTGQSPAVEDYLYEAGVFGEKGGRIWVMPAGSRDQEYHLALAQLDWISLYQSHDGFAFINQLKQQWEELLHPDYVLVDCRSGRTPVEGICTRQLPDAVVVLFSPDAQHLAGLVSVCHAIRTETDRGRPDPIALHFVMSNVLVSEEELEELLRRRQGFLERLHIADLAATLHHREGLVTFDRRLLVLDRPKSRLVQEYRALVDAVIIGNVDDEQGGLLFLDQMERAYAQGAVGAELEEEENRLGQFRDRHWNNAPFLLRLARCLMTGDRLADAERALDRVLEDLPATPPEARLQRARCRRLRHNTSGAIEDLEAYVHLPGLTDEQLLVALRQLYQVNPTQFDDLRARDEVRALQSNRPVIWPPLTFTTDEGEVVTLGGEPPPWYQALGRLDRLRLEVLVTPHHDATEWSRMTPEQCLRRRIRDIEERIRNLEEKRSREDLANLPRDDSRRNWNTHMLASDHFDLALTHWKATGLLPADLCERGLSYHAQLDSNLSRRGVMVNKDPSYRQRIALALWRTGRIPEARKEIAEAETTVSERGEAVYESAWRSLDEVTREQFLEDCEQIRHLIRGVPEIQPAFLREAGPS